MSTPITTASSSPRSLWSEVFPGTNKNGGQLAAVFRSASDFAYVCSKEESVAFRFTPNDFTDGFQGWELITTRVKNRLKLLADCYFLLDKELHAGCAQVTANPSEAVALTVDNLNLRVYLHTVEIALFGIILHGIRPSCR